MYCLWLEKKLKKFSPLCPAPMMPSHSTGKLTPAPRCAKKLSAIFLSPPLCACGGLDFFQKKNKRNKNKIIITDSKTGASGRGWVLGGGGANLKTSLRPFCLWCS